jgi:type II restriction enzyme
MKKEFDSLVRTFKKTIYGWNYFVDFEKSLLNKKNIEIELNILNYLIGKDDIENEFISLIKKYPDTRKVLPILIATRYNNLNNIIIDNKTSIVESKKYIFTDPIDSKIEEELLIFFRDSGLKELFVKKDIKNLVDYCFGVEVGLDSNARKNRTGKIMEGIVENHIDKFCTKNSDFIYISQATKDRIKEEFDYDITIDKNNRKFDFAIYNKKDNNLCLIETNYYNSQGSKLKATAGEYKALAKDIEAQGIVFIWITDGMGWHSALNSLEETYNSNDYIFNLDMLENHNILEKILVE